jgi:hypothetical protein
VNWNHHPQTGVRVEISDLGAPWGCVGSAARATTITSAEGAFTIAVIGLSTNTPVGAFVCAYGPFLDGGRPAVGGSSSQSVGSIDLAREITSLSVHDGDRMPAGPLTITWDAVPEATSYASRSGESALGTRLARIACRGLLENESRPTVSRLQRLVPSCARCPWSR